MVDPGVTDAVRDVAGAGLALTEQRRVAAADRSATVVFGAERSALRGTTLPGLVEAGYLAEGSLDRFETARDRLGPGGSEHFRIEVYRAAAEVSRPFDVWLSPLSAADESGYVWSLTEVGTKSRYGQTVEALHRATRELMGAESRSEVYRLSGRAANDVLGFPGTGVREYDPETDRLVHVAFGGKSPEIDDRPPFPVDGSPHGEAFRTGKTVCEEVPDDDPFDRELFSHTMYVPLGEYGVLSVGRVGGAFEDTDRRLAEVLAENTVAALDRVARRERVERKNARLEQFASIVSHDLRNPLGLAKGAFESYRETGDPERADDVSFALDRMDRLIEEVLTLARYGTDVEETTAVDLGRVAREAWDSVDAAGELHAPDAVVVADRDRLLRLLENLLANAVVHGDDGPTSVTVDTTPAGFYVADDGPGIPPDRRGDVFESGYTTDEAGTGFGLTIVEDIASAHGWSVDVTDSESGGARFEVTGVSVSPDDEAA